MQKTLQTMIVLSAGVLLGLLIQTYRGQVKRRFVLLPTGYEAEHEAKPYY